MKLIKFMAKLAKISKVIIGIISFLVFHVGMVMLIYNVVNVKFRPSLFVPCLVAAWPLVFDYTIGFLFGAKFLHRGDRIDGEQIVPILIVIKDMNYYKRHIYLNIITLLIYAILICYFIYVLTNIMISAIIGIVLCCLGVILYSFLTVRAVKKVKKGLETC